MYHICGLSLLLVLAYIVVPKVFLGVQLFSSLHKNQHSKFPFNQNRGPAGKPAKADMASYLNVLEVQEKDDGWYLVVKKSFFISASKTHFPLTIFAWAGLWCNENHKKSKGS